MIFKAVVGSVVALLAVASAQDDTQIQGTAPGKVFDRICIVWLENTSESHWQMGPVFAENSDVVQIMPQLQQIAI